MKKKNKARHRVVAKKFRDESWHKPKVELYIKLITSSFILLLNMLETKIKSTLLLRMVRRDHRVDTCYRNSSIQRIQQGK